MSDDMSYFSEACCLTSVHLGSKLDGPKMDIKRKRRGRHPFWGKHPSWSKYPFTGKNPSCGKQP